ncbi:MAG: hypothetical protein Q7J84_12945 [Sulfuricaulis sp.]|nr:hypothetical protein [Sulfuricaulis sp.]
MNRPGTRRQSALRTQRGFLLITAVILIVVVALLATVITFLTAGNVLSSAGHANSAKALFIAESGIERGIRALVSPVLTERVGCADVTDNVNLTNIAFGEGRFTLTGGAASYPNNANNTLKAGIGIADVVIPLNDLAGFTTTGGRVLIDREAIDYRGVSSNTAICGGAALTPCLVGAQRGRDGTAATTHASSTRVGQFQCNLQSQGGVPDMAGSSNRRTLRTGVQVQEGWAVGNLGGSATTENLNAIHCTSSSNCWGVADNGVVVYWNGSTWTQDPFVAAENLNGVHCFDANNCIAVGDNGTILRYNSGAWGSEASPVTSNLNGVYCTSATNCWAVGDTYNPPGPPPTQEAILQRTAGGWSLLAASGTIPNENLNGIHCFNANNCIAVGDNGTILSYSFPPGNWSNVASPVTSNINSVYCTAATSCWAVADTYNPPGPPPTQEAILRWNGGAWTLLADSGLVPSENLNSIYCLDASNCFAAGDNGTLLRWNGVNWSDVSGGVTTENMNGIFCFSVSDCIAVGDNGTVLRWNGTSWLSTVTPALLRWNGVTWSDASGLLASGINRDLRAVTVLSYADSWVVGETGGGAVAPCLDNRARIGRWDGASWTCSASSPSNRNLNSVSAVSYNDAWAVGAGGSIVRWNGVAWSEQNAAQNITARELHGVHALGSAEIWMTGRNENAGGKTCGNPSAIVLRYTGAWSCQNTGAANRRYRSIFMFPDGMDAGTQPDDGWIVGDLAGNDFSIFRWNNPVANQWNNQSFTDNTNRERLNSVTMLDTDGDGLGDDGWAVGRRRNNYLTILRWNHACAGGAATGTWVVCSINPGAAALRQHLNAVSCVHARECWAVGNGGLILYWNGANWTVHPQSGGLPGVLTTANLNGIDLLGARGQPSTAWREIFQ